MRFGAATRHSIRPLLLTPKMAGERTPHVNEMLRPSEDEASLARFTPMSWYVGVFIDLVGV